MAYREGQRLAKNGLKIGQKEAKMAQNFEFCKSTQIYRTLNLKIELGTPKNIGFATKLAFLGFELP